jgi:Leucine-rich repeat (LRR) protein
MYHSIVCQLDLPSHLETLSLNWCSVLGVVPQNNCQVLQMSFCDAFDYGCIAGMTGLKGLKLEQMGVRGLEFVSPLASLHSLSLSECAQLTDIRALAGLRLQKLKLEYCPLLADIDSLLSLAHLTVLKLLECHHIANADLQRVLDRLSNLCELSVRHHRITVLNLAKLPSLTCVRLYDCVDLADLSGLPAGLLELNLDSCFRLRDFDILKRLTDLRYLNVCDCRIAQLPKLPALRELNVSHCDNLTDRGLVNVFPCPELRCLIMHDCEQVTTQSRTFTNFVPSVVC